MRWRVAIVAAAAWLLLWHLGDRPLWGDEAETAMLALSVVEHGLPRVEAEGNTVSLYDGHDAGASGLWTWSPWLDEYVAAPALALLPRTAWAARLPFALAGLLAVVAIGALARRLWDGEVATASMLLLSLSVPFVLHARQCRYYALVVLAEIVVVHGFARIASGAPRRGAAALAAGLAILGHSNYVLLPGTVAALGVAAVVERRRDRLVVPATAVATLAGLAVVVPWMLLAGSFGQTAGLDLAAVPANAAWYLWRVDRDVLPLALLVVLPLAGRLRRRAGTGGDPAAPGPPRHPVETLLWAVGPASIAVLAAAPFRYFRYLVPLLPVAALLGAVLIVRHVRSRPLRFGLLAAVCLTSVLSWPVSLAVGRLPPPSPATRLVASIARAHEDRGEAVIEALRARDAAGETVLVADPEFPLMFHARVRVIDARFAARVVEPPDWILPRSATGVVERSLPVPPAVAASYDRIELDVPASRRGGGRPDPLIHEWTTADGRETFVMYRRRR